MFQNWPIRTEVFEYDWQLSLFLKAKYVYIAYFNMTSSIFIKEVPYLGHLYKNHYCTLKMWSIWFQVKLWGIVYFFSFAKTHHQTWQVLLCRNVLSFWFIKIYLTSFCLWFLWGNSVSVVTNQGVDLQCYVLSSLPVVVHTCWGSWEISTIRKMKLHLSFVQENWLVYSSRRWKEEGLEVGRIFIRLRSYILLLLFFFEENLELGTKSSHQ